MFNLFSHYNMESISIAEILLVLSIKGQEAKSSKQRHQIYQKEKRLKKLQCLDSQMSFE